ncbi:MAG: hypothetical protein SVJ22_10955, partial [Halobacteriota archaeon]|nr:hypothetical protein [Halobacteriota archaeon]
PDYTNGMRAMFFSDTSLNPWGYNITGIGDMTNHIPEGYWHYYVSYPTFYPAIGGYTVKYVSDIEIFSSETPTPSGGDTSASLEATVDVTVAMLGISINRTEIDYGNIKPGYSSDEESIEIENIGSLNTEVFLEVRGNDPTAQEFYDTSLFVNGGKHDPLDLITSIPVSGLEVVDTVLIVPNDWNDGGAQDASFVFWAEM